MAESGSKGGNFAKVIQKRVFRTKEKVLQNLGKADRTTDDLFDEHVEKFSRQQGAASRIDKELKNYIVCVKAMAAANKSFYEAIRDTYEDEWTGHEEIMEHIENLRILWEDYQIRLVEEVQNPLQTYRAQFPDLRTKINKRGRKQVDYDSARHNLDALNNAKKRDEIKITKAQEDLSDAKKIYDDLNNELHNELPTAYESRISFTSSHFHALFATEAKFQEESAKIKNAMSDVAEKLAKESGGFNTAVLHGSKRHDTSMEDSQQFDKSPYPSENRGPGTSTFYSVDLNNSLDEKHPPETEQPAAAAEESEDIDPVSFRANHREEQEEEVKVTTNGDLSDHETSLNILGVTQESTETQYEPITVGAQLEKEGGDDAAPSKDDSVYSTAADTDDIYKTPLSNAPIDKNDALPEGVLYVVQATHAYTGEDTDELTFEMGDMIHVIPFEDPEEQDEGWLMGLKLDEKKKGVFPANFTKRM